MAEEKKGGLSRRGFIKGAAAVAATSGLAVAKDREDDSRRKICDDSRDLNLVNGRFLTMDDKNRTVSAVAIRGGRIARVGRSADLGPCSRTINLKGATVIPGLIDSHVHHIRESLNPGHSVRIIETAQSIAELQSMISGRIKQLAVPRGEFICCIGGWNTNALAELRLPTAAELDAAAPNNPVYLSTTGTGGGIANTAGNTFFKEKGIVPAANGTVNTAAAFVALRQAELAGDARVSTRAKGTQEVNDFTVGLGMTSVHDVGGNGGFTGNTSLFVDLKPYEQAMDRWRDGDLYPRHRIWLWSDHDNTTAIVRTEQSIRRLGDDIFRVVGVGERTNISTTDPGFFDNCLAAAKNGWSVHQHSGTTQEIDFHLSVFERVNAIHSIKDLRWQPTHVNAITDAQLDRFIALRTGVTVQSTSYTSGTPTSGVGGTPFRRILDRMGPAGLPVGGGSDATNVGAFNPWLMMYFMITGKNNAGWLMNTANGNQNVTRLEALRMYTMGSAYYSFDDDILGSIEVGKLADLAVLNDDPLTVSEQGFKRLHSTLTLVGGKIVHGSREHHRDRGDRD
jgi:predicted amidohydrolase YtcJ